MRMPAAISALAVLAMLIAQSAQASLVVYVANADSREIGVFTLDGGNGHLAPMQIVPVTGLVFPLAIPPDHRFIYAGLRSEPYSVSTFAIDPESGRLEPRGTEKLADNMAYLSTDNTGRYLFGASYTGNRISVNAIDANGTVHPEPLQVIATRPNAHAILPDPSNHFVFATNLGGDIIQQYRFDVATGRLTPNDPPFVATAKSAGPRFFRFHPNGRFLYATDELGGTLDAYRFDAVRGTLTSIATIKVAPDDLKAASATADLHFTPDGKFLYATERTSNTLVGWRVDPETGALTLVSRTPTEQQPRGFNIDPTGRYLLAVGQMSNAMTSYAIDRETGALTPVFHMPMGKNPNWVEILAFP